MYSFRKNIKQIFNNKCIIKRHNSNFKDYVERKFNEYDKHRFVNYPNIPIFKIALGCGIFTLSSFGCYLVFKEPIHSYLSSQGSEIASNIVKSNDVQTSFNDLITHPETTHIVSELSENVINKLCQNAEVQNKLAQLIIDVLERPDVKEKITDYVIEIINQPMVINELNKTVKTITEDETNVKQVTKLLTNVIESDDTNKSIKTGFYKLFFK